jgi:hypothetical protein
VTTEQRYPVRQLAPLLERNHSESATTTSFPVYGEITRIDLPGVLGDSETAEV